MRWLVLLGWVLGWALAILVAGSCGARTGLEAPFVDRPLEKEPLGEGGGPPECVVYQSSAQLAALDVFMMIDKSGSMSESAVGGTKWNSVSLALSSFFFDPESAGIGVSLGYFPKIDPSVQITCNTSADCSSFGQCVWGKVCGTSLVPCIDQGTCDAKGVGDQPCVPAGQCPDDSLCIPDLAIGCAPASCVFSGLCDNVYECEPSAYATPAVEVSQLPGAAEKLIGNVHDQTFGGATPTEPALIGATDLATDWLADHPEHEVIMVLATDGQPSACGTGPVPPNEALVAIAADALAEGVRTFVIGVFSEEQAGEAEIALGNIAAAGGSDEAFVISTGESVADAFLAALNQVRLDAKACEFGVQVDEPIDFDEVWVKISSDAGEPVWIPVVDGAADCDKGGFYYDPSPTPADAYINVVLCPESCTLLGASPDRRAEIYTACPQGTPSR